MRYKKLNIFKYRQFYINVTQNLRGKRLTDIQVHNIEMLGIQNLLFLLNRIPTNEFD